MLLLDLSGHSMTSGWPPEVMMTTPAKCRMVPKGPLGTRQTSIQ